MIAKWTLTEPIYANKMPIYAIRESEAIFYIEKLLFLAYSCCTVIETKCSFSPFVMFYADTHTHSTKYTNMQDKTLQITHSIDIAKKKFLWKRCYENDSQSPRNNSTVNQNILNLFIF